MTDAAHVRDLLARLEDAMNSRKLELLDGKLSEFTVTWDNVTILTQLGHLPG